MGSEHPERRARKNDTPTPDVTQHGAGSAQQGATERTYEQRWHALEAAGVKPKSGKLFGSKLIVIDQLVLGLARDKTELENAAADVLSQMRGDLGGTGILVLSQSLAGNMLGPVPSAWLNSGMTMHRSTNEDLISGAKHFIDEYLALRNSMS
jgi:hypothetical protein